MKTMILVLNADFRPIHITSLKKGFKLVFKGKAEVISFEDANPIKTPTKNIDRPTIVKLVNYVAFPYKKVPLSRTNVFRRDDNTCVYCGSKRNLTLDHVIPKSRGGTNAWNNLVTACIKCNTYKRDRTPEQANMIMNKKPFTPSFSYFLSKSDVKKEWKEYFETK